MFVGSVIKRADVANRDFTAVGSRGVFRVVSGCVGQNIYCVWTTVYVGHR